MDSGSRITGGGSGYVAHFAHAGGVLYGTELGSVTFKRDSLERDKKRAAGDVNDAPAAKKHSNAPPSAEIKEQEGTKHIAKEDEDEDEKEEDEDKDDTGDEDEDEDEDEDSDEGDEEASCGAAGEQEGVGDGKSAADVLIVGEEKSQHHNEDGKRGSEGVNDAPAATQAKTTTLSTEQQSFVSKFLPAAATIHKKRKFTTRHVKGRMNSLKKQGARVADVKGTTLSKRPQRIPWTLFVYCLRSGVLWRLPHKHWFGENCSPAAYGRKGAYPKSAQQGSRIGSCH